MKPSRPSAILIATLGLIPIGDALAQVQLPVERPTSGVGTIWKYRTIDLWNNSQLSTFEQELVQAEGDRLTFRNKSSLQNRITTFYMTADLAVCRSMRNSAQEVCGGWYTFPIQVGNKHSFEKLPWPSGDGYLSETCVVKATETITVPAGTFDTVRIECDGYWTRVFGGSASGKVSEVIWYAPKANRFVKTQYFDYAPNTGRAFTKSETQLVEMQLK